MYKGNYTPTDFNGNQSVYFIGDKILFEGNIYEAITNTSFSPSQFPVSWKITGYGRPFISERPPLNPIVGQQWVNDGILYTYYQDADGYSWVEL